MTYARPRPPPQTCKVHVTLVLFTGTPVLLDTLQQ